MSDFTLGLAHSDQNRATVNSGGSIPGAPIGYRIAKPIWLNYAGRVCRGCRECSCGAHPRAHPEKTGEPRCRSRSASSRRGGLN